jgi:hypothetical protein
VRDTVVVTGALLRALGGKPPLAMLGAILLAVVSPSDAAPSRRIACGGFPLPFDTTIGATGPSRAHLSVSSIIGLAAVIPAGGSDLTPRAWMIWDEKGMAWLALRKTSPAALRRKWVFPTAPDFSGPGIQVRFTPLKDPLPRGYQLASCPDVSGAAKP